MMQLNYMHLRRDLVAHSVIHAGRVGLAVVVSVCSGVRALAVLLPALGWRLVRAVRHCHVLLRLHLEQVLASERALSRVEWLLLK